MFVLRAILVLVFAGLFAPVVDAQLFRLRRPPQPQQGPSTFDAATFQYTQVRQPVTRIPGRQLTLVPTQQVILVPVQQQQVTRVPAQQVTRVPVQQVTRVPVQQVTRVPAQQVTRVPVQQRYTVPQQQNPRCAQRTAYVPATRQTAQAYVQPPRGNSQQSTSQVVLLTVRDARTGRLYKRPYVISSPLQQPTNQSQLAGLAASQYQPAPAQTLQTAPVVAGSASPILNPPSTEPTVATTSFESPIDDSSDKFSVLDSDDAETSVSTEPELILLDDSNMDSEETTPELPLSTLEPTEPEVAAPALSDPDANQTEVNEPAKSFKEELTEVGSTVPEIAEPETSEPGGLEFDTDSDFDLDLPPLGTDDSE